MSTKKKKTTRTRVGKYELGKTLGEGSFAKVKFAKNVETGENVAIKILDRDQVLRHRMVEQVKTSFPSLPINIKKIVSKRSRPSINMGLTCTYYKKWDHLRPTPTFNVGSTGQMLGLIESSFMIKFCCSLKLICLINYSRINIFFLL